MSEPGAVVLDASALLAYLNAERGAGVVAARLRGALLSTVNLTEVIARAAELGHRAEDVPGDIAMLGVELIPFSAGQALAAAQLRPATRSLGLSLGDRACLALGLEWSATVLTADGAWAALSAPHRIQVIR